MQQCYTVEPRNNETTGESQKNRFCKNFVTARMKPKWHDNCPQTENLFLKVGYITLQALHCRNFTAQLSHYKKQFIASCQATGAPQNDRIMSNASKTFRGFTRLCTFFSFSPWHSAPSISEHTEQSPASSADELCQTVASRSNAVHKTKWAPLCWRPERRAAVILFCFAHVWH